MGSWFQATVLNEFLGIKRGSTVAVRRDVNSVVVVCLKPKLVVSVDLEASKLLLKAYRDSGRQAVRLPSPREAMISEIFQKETMVFYPERVT